MDDLKKLLAVYLLAASYCISGGQTAKSTTDLDCHTLHFKTNETLACVCNNWHLWTNEEGSSDQWPRIMFEKNVNQWSDICRSFFAQGTCMKNARPECKSLYGEDIVKYLNTSDAFFLTNNEQCFDNRHDFQPPFIWNSVFQFYTYACIDDQLTPQALSVVNDYNPGVNLTCVTRRLLDSQERCISWYEHPDKDDSLATETLNCMFSAINRSPCDTAARRVMYFVARVEMYGITGGKIIYADESTTVDFRSLARCTVGVYGDPHLKMCLSESLVLCSAPGDQTYISNKYMTIRGTNVGVGVITEPRVTALKSISLTFNSIETGQVIATYNTTNGAVPATFDGSTSDKAGSGNDTVEITVDLSNRIRFVQNGTGALLVLRQWDGNYFFTLRMTDTVILDSKGLLNDGCPEDQIVNRDQFLWRNTPCSGPCYSSVGDRNNFYSTCKIDCQATGDFDFATNMSKGAQEDVDVVVTFDQALREGAVHKTITSSLTTVRMNNDVTPSRKTESDVTKRNTTQHKTTTSSPTTVRMNSDVTPTVTKRNTRYTGAIESSSGDVGMTYSTSRPTIDPNTSSSSVLGSGYILCLIPTSAVIYLLAFK